MPALLDIEGLHKNFGPISVLRGVDLSLHAGEVLAVVGDNGAGKTTLIKHIAGVYRADAGDIRLNGAPIRMRPPKLAGWASRRCTRTWPWPMSFRSGANIFLGREPVRRWLGILPMIDNRAIRTETEALLRGSRAAFPTAGTEFRACPADSGRPWRSPGRSIGRRRW